MTLQVVALDDTSPSGYDELTRHSAASARDRWCVRCAAVLLSFDRYDKIFCLIVYANSEIAINLEHTPCDAPAIASMVRLRT